jgi:ribosomal-protein-alanine N-acetyltransferase
MAVRSIDLAAAHPFAVQLSPMRRKHLSAVVHIEQLVYSQPWTLSLFVSELALRINRSYNVAKVGDVVVGYAGMSFLDDEAHVTTIAVDPSWQRRGIASRLMVHGMRHAIARGTRNVTLEVRMSNSGAQHMYRRFGFAPGGIRKKYYENTEDAIVMWAHDVDSDEYAKRLAHIEDGIEGLTIAESVR